MTSCCGGAWRSDIHSLERESSEDVHYIVGFRYFGNIGSNKIGVRQVMLLSIRIMLPWDRALSVALLLF